MKYDAIVIGAGINGLVTAAYLGRAGRRVLVLERRDTVGGSAVTEEFAPGFRGDVLAHDIGWLPPTIAAELGVPDGLLVSPDPAVVTPLPAGGHLALGSDERKTVESIRGLSARDAAQWPEFASRMHRLAGFLEALYALPPPQIDATAPRELLTLLGLGRRFRGLGKRGMIDLLRVLPMSVAELLNDWFESDALKGTLGAGGVTGLFQGPRSGGTAFVMLHHLVGAGGFRARTVVRGGVGALAQGLSGAARRHGVEIRTGAEVSSIAIAGERATGVRLTSGEELAAAIVVSGADPRRTFLDLVGPQQLDADFAHAVRQIKCRGIVAKVNLAVGALPRFRGIDEAGLRGAISISPSLDYLERAYDDAKHGAISTHPYLEVRIPTLLDPEGGLAPAGTHVLSIWAQYAPYALGDGGWTPARREALGRSIVAQLAEYAPNLPPAILHQQVLTPQDIETTYGLTEGSLYHGELTLDQILFMRPVAGWSRYRTPIPGLYLCGAGAHPGRGIAGGAGYNAARAILRS